MEAIDARAAAAADCQRKPETGFGRLENQLVVQDIDRLDLC